MVEVDYNLDTGAQRCDFYSNFVRKTGLIKKKANLKRITRGEG